MVNKNSIIPGYENKAHNKTERKIQELKARRSSIKEAFLGNKKYYDEKEAPKGIKGEAYETMVKQLDKLDEIDAQIKELQGVLDKGAFEIDPGYNDDPYIPSELGYSLGDNNGRAFIGRKLERMPLDHYEETYTASEYVQGTVPETNFESLMSMLKTTEDDSIMFDSDIAFGEGIRDDDKENVEKAIAHAHDVGFINAENKKAFAILRGAKDPLTIDASEVHVAINDNLNGKGKKHAVIIVNKDGFAKLDKVDSEGGYPLVKRIGSDFVYRDKYVIQEVDNEILPNNEDGKAPVIVGDMSIVKFLVMRDDSLVKDDFMEFKIHDRRLKREVVALTTTSDSAYIHGTLA